MSQFKAHVTPWRVGVLSFIAFGFVLGGIWLTGVFVDPPNSARYSHATTAVIGWLCVSFFGFVFVASIKQLLGPRERVVMNAEGIKAVQWSDHTIPWTEINNVTVWKHRGSSFITLHLRNPSKYPGRGLRNRLRMVDRFLAGGDVWISLVGTDKGLTEALAAVEHFWAKATPDVQSEK